MTKKMFRRVSPFLMRKRVTDDLAVLALLAVVDKSAAQPRWKATMSGANRFSSDGAPLSVRGREY